MGAAASIPKTEAEALGAGYTQAQIDEYKQGGAAAEAKSTGDSDGASRSRPTLTTEQRLPDVRVACVGVVVRTAAARMPWHLLDASSAAAPTVAGPAALSAASGPQAPQAATAADRYTGTGAVYDALDRGDVRLVSAM